MMLKSQKAILTHRKWQDEVSFPGVRDLGMLDIVKIWQLGISYWFFPNGKYGGQVIIKRGSQMTDRKSEGHVVLMIPGNSGGGKVKCPLIFALIRDT